MTPDTSALTGNSAGRGGQALGGTGRWSFDLRSEELRWSDETCAHFGVPPTSSISLRRALSTLHPEDLPLMTAEVARWSTRIDPFAFWPRVVHPDGSVRVIEVRGGPAAPDGAHRVVGTDRDVTGQLPAAARRWRLAGHHEAVLEALGDGVCSADGCGRIVSSNPALRAFLGRGESELLGRTLHEVVHVDPDGASDHLSVDCPYAAPGASCDRRVRHADGSLLEVRYKVTALDGADASGGLAIVMHDGTVLAEAERVADEARGRLQAVSAQRGALLGALAEAQERERGRIASEIHDDTIQTLGAVALRLDRMRGRALDPLSADALVDAAAEVREVAGRLRKVMVDLMPPVVIGDLVAALRSYCAVLFDDGSISYEVTGSPQGLGGERSLLAYRLVQEALRNVRRHAHANAVRVEFETDGDTLGMSVRDDGVGMRSADGETPLDHAGLRVLRNRVQAAGGELRFGVGLGGRGAALHLRIPLTSSGS